MNDVPTPEQLKDRDLVAVDAVEAKKGQRNGWPAFYWDGSAFFPLLPHMTGLQLYINEAYLTRRKPTPPPPPNPKPPVMRATITFESDGGSLVNPENVVVGSSIAEPPTPSRAGYDFAGWYHGGPPGVEATWPFFVDGDTTMFAVWTAIVEPPAPPTPPTPPTPPAPPAPPATGTVTFVSQGGGTVSPITGDDGSTIVLPTPTYPGYTFDGWFTNATGGVSVTGAYTIVGNSTLYAQWSPVDFTVMFDSKGGEPVSPITATNGSAIELLTPTYEGYTFDGWVLIAGGLALISSPYTVTGDVTLYAQWTAVVVPPPVVTPPANSYAWGIEPPAPDAGFTRSLFDAFTGNSLSPEWSGAYNGQSEAGGGPGIFLASHLVVTNGMLQLQAYPDPANWSKSWKSTAEIAAAVNYWCGAGCQSTKSFVLPATFYWSTKWDTWYGLTPIVLTIGVWPPEMDLIEASVAVNSQPVTGYASSYLYDSPKQQVQIHISVGSVDMSQPHLWKAVATLAGCTIYVDGVEAGLVEFTSEMVSGANGLQQPMNICLQQQTGDGNNPVADPSITSANPVTQYFGFFAMDIPTESAHLVTERAEGEPVMVRGHQQDVYPAEVPA